MNNKGVGTRFSIKQEEATFDPMWHGKGKGEIHVAKQVKRKLIYLWVGLKKNSRVKVNEHVEHGNQAVK